MKCSRSQQRASEARESMLPEPLRPLGAELRGSWRDIVPDCQVERVMGIEPIGISGQINALRSAGRLSAICVSSAMWALHGNVREPIAVEPSSHVMALILPALKPPVTDVAKGA